MLVIVMTILIMISLISQFLSLNFKKSMEIYLGKSNIKSYATIISGLSISLNSCIASDSLVYSNSITNPDNLSSTIRSKVIRQTELFLTNPVLETIRKIDQLDPDTEDQAGIKVISFIPIMEINKDIEDVVALIQTKQKTELTKALSILWNKKFDAVIFKKIFNKYSDNIFYTDSRQANLYLNGGAIPSSQQTQQYLFRNSILNSVIDMKQDLEILINSFDKGSQTNIPKNKIDESSPINSDSDFDQFILDALDDCQEALGGLKSYFDLADPQDVQMSKEIVYSKNK